MAFAYGHQRSIWSLPEDAKGNITFEQAVATVKMRTAGTSGLPRDWAYSPALDLELKQYTLLGYLQRVKARFAERKLYPYLEQLRGHVNELLDLQRSKESLEKGLSGDLIGFDTVTGQAIHARQPQPELLNVIDDVIGFAVPGLMQVHDAGVELREELFQHLRFSLIGLQPLHATEGWLLLRSGAQARVYHYSIPFLLERSADLSHRNVFTHYVSTYSVGLVSTFDRIKSDLIERHPAMPNPATFAVETELDLPCIETFMPLAKRMVHAHVMAGA